MIPPSIYIIKSSVLLATFLVYYILILKRHTFFTLNRAYLLGSLILSVCVPLFHFTIPAGSHIAEAKLPTLYYIGELMEEITVTGHATSEGESLSHLNWLYLGGIGFFTLYYIIGLIQICRFIGSHKYKRIDHLRIIFISSEYPTFSFFNYIFINTTHLNTFNMRQIFEHEKTHVWQGHSFDLLIAEIICILNWYNPLVWIYKKSIIQNHEYIADKQVIVKYQTGSYLQLLVNQALKGNVFSIISHVQT